MKFLNLKIVFILLTLLTLFYTLFFKTEKYESSSIVMVKDLSQKQSTSPLGALLSVGNTGTTQDSMLLDVYIKSSDVYDFLDKEYNLTTYYSGEEIDYFSRLYENSPFGINELNRVNLLKSYRKDLTLLFDDASSTLSISFSHADAKMAQMIVQSIIIHATDMLNEMEKKSSTIVLKFLKQVEREKYDLFLHSLKKLLNYQNSHNTINPKIDVETKSEILATLEAELVQKKVAFQDKSQYMNPKAPEMKLLRGNISHIESSIRKIQKEMTGKSNNSSELNRELADFELLKSEVDFNKEVYQQILSKLEESAIMASQNTKNLIVVSSPKIADSYTYPNKLKDAITIIILLSLLYGITGLIVSIIQDHKD
jgi:capsular polysaccharide transport system permease protein